MIFFKLDLEEVRERLGVTYNKEAGGTHKCLLCGKPIKKQDFEKGKFVHMDTDGYLVPTDLEVENSQGLHPVGPDCARKLNNLIKIAN
jgi:hypothetical protein